MTSQLADIFGSGSDSSRKFVSLQSQIVFMYFIQVWVNFGGGLRNGLQSFKSAKLKPKIVKSPENEEKIDVKLVIVRQAASRHFANVATPAL